MDIVYGEKSVTLHLTGKKSWKLTALYIGEAFMCAACGILGYGFIYYLLTTERELDIWDHVTDGLFAIFIFILGTIGMFGAWKLISKINTKESLVILEDRIEIINKAIGGISVQRYSINDVSELIYCGQPENTQHPLAGESFDYYGFAANNQLISKVNDEGHIFFYYQGRHVFFGKNIYSWDAKKIHEIFLEVTRSQIKMHKLPEEIPESIYARYISHR